jgi:Rad3-related DNA helicase
MNEKCVIFNYDYFLHETCFVGDFGKRKMLVADEAHNTEGKLMNFVGMKISGRDLDLIQEPLPTEDRPVIGE